MEKLLRVSSIKLQNNNGDELEVCDDGNGEMSINACDGDWFCFSASDADAVISFIRDMAEKSLSHAKPAESEKPEPVAAPVVRNTRSRR